MQKARDMLKDLIGGCGYDEVDELSNTQIDLGEVYEQMQEDGIPLTYNNLMYEAFRNEIYRVFGSYRELCNLQDDFDIYTNGALDTHITIYNGRYDFYKKNYPDQIDEIENYMNLEFEDSDYRRRA